MSFKFLVPALLAASIGFTSLPMATPAEAGQITFKISPKGKDARALRTGLAIFGAIQGMKNKARVDQNGNNNSAGVAQNGSGNGVAVIQNGSGHTGTVTQNGNGNGFGLFQFGKNTTGNFTQTGNGNLDLVLQGGW